MNPFIILTLFVFTFTKSHSNINIEELLKKQEQEERMNPRNGFELPNVLMFTFKNDPKILKDISQYSKIIKEVLNNKGVPINIVKIQNNEMIATVPPMKYFDQDAVVKHFEGVLERIDMGDFSKSH